MHEKLWQQLTAEPDYSVTAKRAACGYQPDPDRLRIKFLNTDYTVIPGEMLITSEIASRPGFLEQLCILAYLISARDTAPEGRLVKAESLPGGQFFFRGPHLLPTAQLEKAFGRDPQVLHRAGRALNAADGRFGDASIEVDILPRVTVVFIIWAEDEEFPARASILFDSGVHRQIPLDALWTAVKQTAKILVKQKNAS